MRRFRVTYHEYTPVGGVRKTWPERVTEYEGRMPFSVEGGPPAPGKTIRRMLTNWGSHAARMGARAVTIAGLEGAND